MANAGVASGAIDVSAASSPIIRWTSAAPSTSECFLRVQAHELEDDAGDPIALSSLDNNDAVTRPVVEFRTERVGVAAPELSLSGSLWTLDLGATAANSFFGGPVSVPPAIAFETFIRCRSADGELEGQSDRFWMFNSTPSGL